MFNLKLKNLKSKKGFSLVELMVVVAIMGTLASIAIPAFNEYRRSAKKNAYRADLTSLHKGWMAFGVELDSFCERETSPKISSIANVGMSPLLTSKLYGEANGEVVSCKVTGSTGVCPHATGDTVLKVGTSCTETDCTFDEPKEYTTYGPGKDNFIGFGADNTVLGSNTACPETAIASRQHKKSTTTVDDKCILNIEAYQMGFGGHISGAQYYGGTINNQSVFRDKTGPSSEIFESGKVCS